MSFARLTPFRVLAVVLVLLIGAAACGSGGDSGTSAGDPVDNPDPGFPVTVDTKYGATTIPNTPKRVVVVGKNEQDALLALGTAPVAVTEWFGGYKYGVWPWAQDELGDAKPVVLKDQSGLSYEKIADLDPDVIVGMYSGMTKKEYETLAKIAPTVAPPKGVADFGVGWDDVTKTVGKILGKDAEADALIADVEAKFAAVRAEHPEFAGKTALMATPYEGIYVYSADDVRGRFLTSLGFTLPEGLDDLTKNDFGGELSEEQVDFLDNDLIVWLDPEEGTGKIGGPLYQNLAVHTEGREVFLDSEDKDGLGGATSFVTVLSLPYLLDGIAPMLSAAVDGNPATAVPKSS